MFKKSIISIFILVGLAWSFSVMAATCPRDNGMGVGCDSGAGFYYCSGSCRNLTLLNPPSLAFCSQDVARPACAPGANCTNAASYPCGVAETCTSGFTLCNIAGNANPSWPDTKCKSNVVVPAGCLTYNQCTNICSACSPGYELLGGVCVSASVKLGSDSVTATFLKNSASPLLTILSGGNVGIGITAPTLLLHVGGGAQLDAISWGVTPGQSQNLALSTVEYVNSKTGGAGGVGVGILGQTLRNDGTGWIADSNLFNTGANVGIGTTAPTARLEVIGDYQAIRARGTATGYNWSGRIIAGGPNVAFLMGEYNTMAWLGAHNAALNAWSDFYINPDGNTKLYLGGTGDGNPATLNPIVTVDNATGNVGIGTTAPNAKLDISNVSNQLRLTYDAANYVKFNVDSSGAIFIQPTSGRTYWNTSSINNNFFVYNNSDGDSYTGIQGNGITLRKTGTQTVSINNSGNSYFNSGNVGIGTTTPTLKLHVAGGAQLDAISFGVTPGQSQALALSTVEYVNSKTGGPNGVGAGTSGQTLRHNGAGWVADSNLFNTGTNVGIGTTNPGAKLNVSGSSATGDLLINNSSSAGSISLASLLAPSGTTDMYFSVGNELTGANSALVGFHKVSSGSSSNYAFLTTYGRPASDLMVNGSGNVGIGTTAPAQKLEIAGALKIANTASVCDATQTGTFKYDPISSQSYLCDGTRWLNQKNCGLMTDDAGQTYNTVQIGGQCWMAENINIGTMLAAGLSEPNIADNIIEKWCYNNDPAQCTAQGGLYNYNEAMRGSKVAGARGICADGWHIPTDAEYNTLEKTVQGVISSPNLQYACNMSVSGWRRCADDNGADSGGTYGVGKSLKAVGVGSGVGAGNDLVGFSGKLSGGRGTNGSCSGLGEYLYLWSSTPSGSSNAWYRNLPSTYSTVTRRAYSRALGFSVRCLRD